MSVKSLQLRRTWSLMRNSNEHPPVPERPTADSVWTAVCWAESLTPHWTQLETTSCSCVQFPSGQLFWDQAEGQKFNNSHRNRTNHRGHCDEGMHRADQRHRHVNCSKGQGATEGLQGPPDNQMTKCCCIQKNGNFSRTNKNVLVLIGYERTFFEKVFWTHKVINFYKSSNYASWFFLNATWL